MPQDGDNSEKIANCDQDAVQGAWSFEKDGGALDNWQDFDASYPWHMGGDVFKIGGTLYCLNVTVRGYHLYKYATNAWECEGSIHENDYYQFHDAQFFEAESGTTLRSTNWFLVSTGGRPEREASDFGIWLVTDGTIGNATRISGTEGEVYGKVYRDPDHDRTFYTWGNYTPSGSSSQFGLWKFVVNGYQGNFDVTAPTYSDFNMTGSGYTLLDITGFCQYLDDTTVRQYLLAQTTHSGSPTWDVWYRYGTGGSLPTTSWAIKWADVTMTASTLEILTRNDIAIQPNGVIIKDNLRQIVPPGAPAGIYTYTVYAGNQEYHSPWGQDSFTFEKLGVRATSVGAADWIITGWDETAPAATQLPKAID